MLLKNAIFNIIVHEKTTSRNKSERSECQFVFHCKGENNGFKIMDLIEVSDNTLRHPWELSRMDCVLHELDKMKIHGCVLDIGCGDGFFDRKLLARHPELEIWGVDIFLQNETHEKNLHAVNSLEHLPQKKFDFVLMMDVLEHIENDQTYLSDIVDKFLAGGKGIYYSSCFHVALFSA